MSDFIASKLLVACFNYMILVKLLIVKLLIVFFVCLFYNNTSRCSLGVFTAELICMKRWASELA